MKSFLLIFLAAAVASAAPQLFNILFVLSNDHSAPHMGSHFTALGSGLGGQSGESTMQDTNKLPGMNGT